jgi:hypothetical protein
MDDQEKKILLRLPSSLWEELAAWAADDIRSINGQIEFLLRECVRRRKKSGPEKLGSGRPE